MKSNELLSGYAPQLVAGVRRLYAHAGTGLAVTSNPTKVGFSVPALRLSASYEGLWLQGAGEQGLITHIIYFFLRGDVLYEFDYSAVTPWATKDLAAFTESAKSIHFLNTA